MPKPTNAELAAKVAELEAALAEATTEAADAAEVKTDGATEAVEEAPSAPRADEPANVIEAIVAVMRDVKALGKNERNTTPGQNYNFRGIDATVNALGPAMRRHGLVVVPTLTRKETKSVQTSSGKTQQASEVDVTYTFYGPGGVADCVQAVVPGESWDSGDKGVAKAMSVAMRIALLQTFALPTDERDPDADTHERAHNVDPRAFLGEVDHALKADDPRQALIDLGDSHGEHVLNLVTVPNPAGEGTITATALIYYHLNAIANAPKPAPEEVVDALKAAKQLLDSGDDDATIEALRAMYPRFSETLHKTTIEYDGVPTIVHEVIQKIVAEVQAKQEAAHAQESDGDARAESAPQPEPTAHHARAEETPAREDAPAEPARAPEQPVSEGAQRAAEQTARDVKEPPVFVPLRSEIAGQAAAVSMEVGKYIEPLLALKQGATKVADLPVGIVQTWVADQRATVIDALRTQGRATEAGVYAGWARTHIAMWDDLIGGNAREEQDAREPQTQQ